MFKFTNSHKIQLKKLYLSTFLSLKRLCKRRKNLSKLVLQKWMQTIDLVISVDVFTVEVNVIRQLW